MTLHVACVRTGPKYSRDYVLILLDMVRRNLDQDFHFWCITDDPFEHPEIGIIEARPELLHWWQKVYLFSPDMPWNEGDRVLYLDLDVAVVGRLEDLADTPGIIRDWNLPGFNSSVMVWNHGEHANIWSSFMLETMYELDGDQDWITSLSEIDDRYRWQPFPREWCASYKALRDEFPPTGTKVVVYHGKPKPHECIDWTRDVWKIGGFTEFHATLGMNVSQAVALDNVRINAARDLTWFTGWQPHKDTAVIVGGSPSLVGHIEAIRHHRQRGSKIVALNGAGHYLNALGITPDVLFVCDARPENVQFVSAQAKTYLIASQCHPGVLDALEPAKVVLVHLAICDEIRDVLDPWWDTKPICVIGGGGTGGLRAMNILMLGGYRKLHIYGMDSSYEDHHHAYAQPMNDGDRRLETYLPATQKNYTCAPWMIRQAVEFRDLAYPTMVENGVRMWVHGKGLLPDMFKELSNGG